MIAEFYDQLAPYYTFLYADWEASVKRQAAVLNGIVREFFGANAQRILDVACGIDTTPDRSAIDSALVSHAGVDAVGRSDVCCVQRDTDQRRATPESDRT